MILTGSDSRSLGRILLGAIHADLYSTAKYCRERSLVQWERLFSFSFLGVWQKDFYRDCLTVAATGGVKTSGSRHRKLHSDLSCAWPYFGSRREQLLYANCRRKKYSRACLLAFVVYIVTVRVFKTSVTSWKLCDLTNSSELGERSKSLSWVVLRFKGF